MAALILALIAGALLAGPAHAAGPDPVDIQYQGEYSYTIHLPVICHECIIAPSPTVITYTLEPCIDERRGQVFRDLVSDTVDILDWPYVWGAAACAQCGVDEAYQKGFLLGQGLGRIPSILGRIFGLIGAMLRSALDSLLSLLLAQGSEGESYDISCEEEAEGICLGLAAIISLDDLAGGWITVIVTLLIAVLTFFLVMYIITQVRNMMQPGAAGGGDDD